MKKVLSVILAVALVVCFATGALSVSAESTDLLNAASWAKNEQNPDGNAVLADGVLTITVGDDTTADNSEAGAGGAFSTPVPFKVSAKPWVMLDIESNVPFRVTFKTGSGKWPSFQGDFYDTVYKPDKSSTFGATDLEPGVSATDGNFLPAGSYQVAGRLYGVEGLTEDDTIAAIYIGGKTKGTITVKNISLIPEAECEMEAAKNADGNDVNIPKYVAANGSADTQAPTTTTKAADGSNVGGGSAQTGDESNVVLFSVVAALAVAVVTVSAVASKKAKSK